MIDTDSELPPYLGSEQTGGHELITQNEVNILNEISVDIDGNEITTLTEDYIDQHEISQLEQQLIAKSGVLKYLPDGNTQKRFPLEDESLDKFVTLLRKHKLSDEELNQVLGKKISLHNAIYIHGLRPLIDRAAENQKLEAQFSKTERWQWTNGNYREDGGYASHIVEGDADELWDKVRNIPEDIKPEELLGEELTVADIIQQQLNSNDGENPQIFIDVGGLAGLSWHRLAYHFREYVQSGKAVFVVTSLGANYDQAIAKFADYQSHDYSPSSSYKFASDKDLILQNKNLVHHITSNVPQLLDATINVNGEDVQLMEHVAFINDNHAVAMHSLIPSMHLRMLALLLTENGVYKTSTTSTFATHKTEHYAARDAELYRAFEIMKHEFGMEHVLAAEQGSTSDLEGLPMIQVFLRKRNGPKIRAFLLPEQLEDKA